MTGRQCRFRKPGNLEKSHVPGTAQLPPMPHFPLKAGRVGRIHNHQGFHAIDVPHRIVPGDDPTPIMPDQNDALNLSGIEKSGHIVHQGFNSIGVYACRPCRAAISPEVRSPDPVPCLCQWLHLIAPRDGGFRKAMETEHQSIPGPRCCYSKGQVVRGYLLKRHASEVIVLRTMRVFFLVSLRASAKIYKILLGISTCGYTLRHDEIHDLARSG